MTLSRTGSTDGAIQVGDPTLHLGAPSGVQAITRGVGGPPVAFVSASSVTRRGPFILDFTGGTWWLVGTQLDPMLAADSLVGILYSTATLVIPRQPPPPPFEPTADALGPLPLSAAIVIPDDVTAQLTVHPATTAPPAGPIDDDGSAATMTPPAQARFELAPDGISLALLADGSATVYGSTITFSGGAAGTRSDTGRREWVAGFTTVTQTPIDFGSPRSAVFVTSGSAVPIAGAWRLPIVEAPPDQLGPSSEGALRVSAGSGVSVVWNRHAPVALTVVDLWVRNGQLRLSGDAGGGPGFTDTYELWDAGTPGLPRPTSIAVSGRADAAIVSTQSAAEDTVEVSGCTIAAHIDRPCLLDGGQPRFDQLTADYFVGVDATGPLFA